MCFLRFELPDVAVLQEYVHGGFEVVVEKG